MDARERMEGTSSFVIMVARSAEGRLSRRISFSRPDPDEFAISFSGAGASELTDLCTAQKVGYDIYGLIWKNGRYLGLAHS